MNRRQRRAAQKLHRVGGLPGANPQLIPEFVRAVQLLQEGRLAESAAAHQRVLAIDPQHAPSLHHLGLIEHKSGRGETAVELIAHSLALKPDDADALTNLSVILKDLGRIDEAIAALEKAVALRPGHAATHFNFGSALRKKGRLDDAVTAYATAVELDPSLAAAQSNLADVLAALDRLDEAFGACQRAIALAPKSAEAHAILAQILHRLGRNGEALLAYNQALALNPGLVTLHTEAGNILRLEGKYEEAIAAHQRTISLQPDCAEAHCHLGIVLQRLGRWEEARASYATALKLAPDFAAAHSNLGLLLGLMGSGDAGIAACRQATALKPKYAPAHYNLGLTLMGQRRTEEAIHAFRQALTCDPQLAQAGFELCNMRRHACDWRGLDQEEADCLDDIRRRAVLVSPFPVLATRAGPAEQLVHARIWARALAVAGSKVFSQYPAAVEGRRIRVGYLSCDFYRHATAALISELIERHDRNRFEIVAYCFSPDDGSDMRKRLRAAFDRVVDIRSLTHAEAARRIHDDQVDILVDLKGYTRDSRMEILAYRPAPIQVNYLGYPGSMGADFIDYIIADPFVAPMECQPHYDEKIVHLPDCYQPNDRQREIAEHTPTRAEAGLPEQAFVFCAFNNAYKITEKMFGIWMRLLDQVPGSVLWLLEANDLCKGNLHREAAVRGIDPSRLVFAPKVPMESHLARQRLADLFLDALPYNAHTTASDALWAGLPVVTCAGETFAGRVAGSLLHAVGLPELVTRTLSDYEALALRLAQQPEQLAAVREKLKHNRLSTPLFDAERYTHNLETAYAHMVRLRAAGRQPEAFAVPDLPTEAELPAMLANPDQPFGRIGYRACPLCDSADIPYHIEADTTRHALYKPVLPKTMKWRSCAGCGHMFTEGYYTPEMCEVIFSDTQPVQRVGHDVEGQRKVSARIVERIARRVTDGDWLDIGFGNASLLFTAQEWGYTPVGVDLRKENVDALRKLQIEAYCIPVEEMDWRERFSVVSMADVLEHMPFPRKVLPAVHRMLRPGGVLFVSMPNTDSIVWRALDAAGTNPYWSEIEHYHNFSRKRLHTLLEQHGFTPLDYNISERYRSCMEITAAR